MVERIGLVELQRMLDEADIDAELLSPYVSLDPDRSHPMRPSFRVDADRVTAWGDCSDPRVFDLDLQSLNERFKQRRQKDFERRTAERPRQVKLLAEGDSWFQFPLILRDVINNVARDFAIYDLSEAGASLPSTPERLDRLEELVVSKEIDGLMLSGGLADIISKGLLGEILSSGTLATDPVRGDDHLASAIRDVDEAFEAVFARLGKRFPRLKIFCHGYDHIVPVSTGHLKPTIGPALPAAGVSERDHSLKAARAIDAFNDVLQRRAANFAGNVCYIDCRGAVGAGGWFDESHPADAGFREVAAQFSRRIEMELRPRYESRSEKLPMLGFTSEIEAGEGRSSQSSALHAFVIGISDYAHLRKLPNALNDAAAMRRAFEELGYTITEALDAAADSLDAKRVAFLDRLEKAHREGKKPVAVVYFAGHGIQIENENFLVPSNALIRTPDDLRATVQLQSLIEDLTEYAVTTIAFLDCCRDDPLQASFGASSWRPLDGLAALRMIDGAFVAYATHPGSVALDGLQGEARSPFSKALSRLIKEPFDSVVEMMIAVTNEVRNDTREKQVPWQQIGLNASFSFNDPDAPESPLRKEAVERLVREQEAALWKVVENTDSVEVARSFAQQYPESRHKAAALARADELLWWRHVRSTRDWLFGAIALIVAAVIISASTLYLSFATIVHNGRSEGIDLMGGDIDLPATRRLPGNAEHNMTADSCRRLCVWNYYRGCRAYNVYENRCYLKKSVHYYDVDNQGTGESAYLPSPFGSSRKPEHFPHKYRPAAEFDGDPIPEILDDPVFKDPPSVKSIRSDCKNGEKPGDNAVRICHPTRRIEGFRVPFADCQRKFLELAATGAAAGFTYNDLYAECYLFKAVRDFLRDTGCHSLRGSATISATTTELNEVSKRNECVSRNLRAKDLIRRYGESASSGSAVAPPP